MKEAHKGLGGEAQLVFIITTYSLHMQSLLVSSYVR